MSLDSFEGDREREALLGDVRANSVNGSDAGDDEGPAVGKSSLNVMFLTVFLQSIGFTIVLPSLWFYLRELGANHRFLGYVVGIYSLGQFTGSLAFGFWSSRRPTIEPLLVSLAIGVLGNFHYGIAEDIPAKKWQVLVARFVVGFGAGNVSVCRAFVSEATTVKNRRANMTIMSAAQGIGFVCGPCLGLVLAFIPEEHVGHFHLNKFTSAGFLSALFCVVNVVILPFFFRDMPSKERDMKAPPTKTPRNEWIALVLGLILFFIIINVFSVFETIGTPLTQHYYGWGTKRNGALFLGAGIVSVFGFGVLIVITKHPVLSEKLEDRSILLVAFVMLVASMAFLTPWKGLPLWQLFMGSFWLSVGYPIASALAYTLYSKVINPNNQSVKMGYLTATGSVARMLGPLWATNLFSVGGSYAGTWVFVSTGITVVLAFVLLLACWRFLEAHPDCAKGTDVTTAVGSFTSAPSSWEAAQSIQAQ